jgi:hypothetical protein
MSFTLLSPVLPPPGWSCREAFSQEFSLGDIQREEETGRSGWLKKALLHAPAATLFLQMLQIMKRDCKEKMAVLFDIQMISGT